MELGGAHVALLRSGGQADVDADREDLGLARHGVAVREQNALALLVELLANLFVVARAPGNLLLLLLNGAVDLLEPLDRYLISHKEPRILLHRKL